MSEAYCLKCRMMVEIQNPEMVILRNMAPALTGLCPISGTKVFRFVRRRLDPVYALVLAIERGDELIALPAPEERIQVEDKLVCYGHLESIADSILQF